MPASPRGWHDRGRAAHGAAVIAGIVQDQHYFDTQIAPHIDGDAVTYIGPVMAAGRSTVLGRAHALLHLIEFAEPFGFSVVEAMACGTPVIAHDRGSMRELIADQVTGFLVNDLDSSVRAVAAAATLDRSTIRNLTVARFDQATMTDRYVAVYTAALRDS
jgi:glycosyltransferase involved in cell wall biosynthesis